MPYRFEGRGPRGFTRRVATAKVGNQIWRETRYMNDLVSVLEPADEHVEPGGPRGDEDAEWIPGFVRSRPRQALIVNRRALLAWADKLARAKKAMNRRKDAWDLPLSERQSPGSFSVGTDVEHDKFYSGERLAVALRKLDSPELAVYEAAEGGHGITHYLVLREPGGRIAYLDYSANLGGATDSVPLMEKAIRVTLPARRYHTVKAGRRG